MPAEINDVSHALGRLEARDQERASEISAIRDELREQRRCLARIEAHLQRIQGERGYARMIALRVAAMVAGIVAAVVGAATAAILGRL